jgi:hypothetical protein
LQRKLSLTVVVILLVAAIGLAVTGQAAQASTNSSIEQQHGMFKHPSYIVKGLLCIHSYEGNWSDSGSPYWGGLQMDMSFQRTYGWMRSGEHKWYFVNKWGTADHWPKWAQVVAGIHAYFSRRWNPWPNTARFCGLA